MDVFDNIGAWGNVNAIVYLERPKSEFDNLVEHLVTDFNADEVIFDWFDLDSNDAGYCKLERWGDNVIGRAILEKGSEKIIVEQLGVLCSVEHLFRPWVLEQETGSATLRTIINDYPIWGWVLGFELDSDIKKIRKNFDVIWSDPSLYPLIVLQLGKDNAPKEYGSYEPMLTMLRAYLTKIS